MLVHYMHMKFSCDMEGGLSEILYSYQVLQYGNFLRYKWRFCMASIRILKNI